MRPLDKRCWLSNIIYFEYSRLSVRQGNFDSELMLPNKAQECLFSSASLSGTWRHELASLNKSKPTQFKSCEVRFKNGWFRTHFLVNVGSFCSLFQCNL